MNLRPSSLLAGLLCLLTAPLALRAANPIITDVFTADPAALVHNGVAYIYTGHDEAVVGQNAYKMKDWLCFSSTDMVNWKAHPSPLKLTDFAWANSDAWAGHVVERNGKFWWYVPMYHRSIPGFSIGVAVSDSPTGPFKDARGSALITNNMTTDVSIFWDDIDPAVFIDDDGQAYLFWGNTKCRYIKLKENMIETEGAITTLNTLPMYTEAPWVHKRNGLYYLTYATEWPERLGYATGPSINGPWTYRGVFKGYARNCGTNHHAIIEFKGRDYLVYHNGGLPTGGDYRRSVCVDYLNYNPDGTIQVVTESTTSVDAVPLVHNTGPGRLTNISVRSFAGTAEQNLIAGFIIAGAGRKEVLMRGVGPTLAGFGVRGELADPSLRVVTPDAKLEYGNNDNWGGDAFLKASASSLRAFTLPDSSKDAALQLSLPTGPTTALISGAANGTGVALVECYDATPDNTATSLRNVSGRAYVGGGDEVLIAGFVISGNTPLRVLIRGTGPALAPLGVPGTLADPQIRLHNSDSVVIASNDNWGGTAELSAAFRSVEAFDLPADSSDAAMIATLQPGLYTVILSGVGESRGVALVEVYALP